MTFNLILILIFFGVAAGNIDISTWGEDATETDTNVTSESIGKLLLRMETEAEPDFELESDWEEMESSEETTEKQYSPENKTDTKEIISEEKINDQNDFKNTTRSDQKFVLETSTRDGINLRSVTEIGEILPEVSENYQNGLKSVTGINKIITEMTASNQSIMEIMVNGSTILPNEENTTEMDRKDGTDSEISPEIGENISETTTAGYQNTTETEVGIAIRLIEEMLSELTAKDEIGLETSTRMKETQSDATTNGQNNLEITTGTTIWPVLSQMNLNKSIDSETVSDRTEIITEVIIDDRNNFEADTSTVEIISGMDAGNENELKNASGIKEIVTEQTLDGQNNLEITTDTTIWSGPLQMNSNESINFETETGIGEIILEMTTNSQNDFKNAGRIGEIVSEITTGDENNLEIATDVGAVVSETTTGGQSNLEAGTSTTEMVLRMIQNNQNNLENTSDMTILSTLSQIDMNEGINLETATSRGEIISEITTRDQNDFEIPTRKTEIVTEVITSAGGNLEADNGIGEMISEVTTNGQNYIETTSDTMEIVSEMSTGDQNYTKNAAGMTDRSILLQTNVNESINLETGTGIKEILLETSTDGQNNPENSIGSTTRPILSVTNSIESINLETAIGMAEIVSDVTLGDQNDTKFTTEIDTESIQISDNKGDSITAKNMQDVSSKMERDDPKDLKTAANGSDKKQRRWKKYGNKKIQRKIVDALKDFSSNYDIYKPIKLSLEHFVPPSAHRMKIGSKVFARIYDFTLEESREDDINQSNYSTVINCKTDSMKIQVSIPTKLIIKARVHLLAFLPSQSVLHQGSISVTYTGASIWGKFNQNGTYEGPMGEDYSIKGLFSNLNFANSQVTFHGIDKEHQEHIYQAVEKLFKKTKHVHDFFIKKLEEKMQKSGISYSSSCSNIGTMAPDNYNSSIPIKKYYTDLNYSYVIPRVKLEPIKGTIIHAGPVVIDGLLNFNSSEFSGLAYDINNEGNNDSSRINDIMFEKINKQITTTNLKGKFLWKLHLKKNVLPFSIEKIEFRSFLWNIINLQEKTANEGNSKKLKINVKVGKININTTGTKFDQNINGSANFILSKYLVSLIGKSLQKSIEKRLNKVLLHEKCNVLVR